MNEIHDAIHRARAKQHAHLLKGFEGDLNQPSEEAIQKGESDANPFDVAAQEIEKSDVMNAIQYGGDIKVTKTGKEIKKNVTDILIPELNASLATKKKEANECLKSCGQAPTKDINPWWTDDLRIEVPFKVYDWEEMRMKSTDDRMVETLSAEHTAEMEKKYNFAKTEAEAMARNQYNDCVRAVCNIMVDLEACRVVQSLKDEKEYELTPKQFATFRF